MNPNSINAHKNMTAKISLHGQMIMSHLPELRTVIKGVFYGETWKGPFKKKERDISVPGATCEGVGRHCKLMEMQVVRRMSELKRAGLVIESPEKFTYISGGKRYSKTIWQAVDNSPK